ncbi:hypothetical protein SBBP2_1110003 [Burkholderiales bacterium]|nr:hypothetical protein SBBP2_1110003 [Burkholderiales bacterium]
MRACLQRYNRRWPRARVTYEPRMGIRCIGRSKLSCGHTLIGVKVLGRCGEDDGYGCCPGAMRFAAGAAFSETRTGARSLQGGMRFSGGDRK